MTFESNCYHNPNTALVFDLFGAGGSWGDLGDLYSFTEWQGQGYDGSSFDEDPALDAEFRATSSSCSAFGHATAP